MASNIQTQIARDQLALLHRSMIEKVSVTISGRDMDGNLDTQIGIVTCICSEDGSGLNWNVWLNNGASLFIKITCHVVRLSKWSVPLSLSN